MQLFSFWWSVGIVYTLMALGMLEAWFDPLFKKFRRVVIWIPVAVAAWFTAAVVLASAPVALEATAIDGDDPGTAVGGISWTDKFVDLRVIISDSGPVDYDNLDLNIQPDGFIARYGQITNIPDVSLSIKTDIPGAILHVTETGGEISQLPRGLGYGGSAFNYPVRVRCGKLPSKGRLQLVFAVVNADPLLTASLGTEMPLKPWESYGPRRTPHVVHITGDYTARERIRHLDEQVVVKTAGATEVSVRH